MAAQYFDEVIPLRLPEESRGSPRLRALTRDDGFIGNPKPRELHPAAKAPRTTHPTSWLPSEALAVAWRELIGGKD
jgi:hypothetical protein